MLRVLDDRLDRLPLRRGGRPQVVVAFDLRAGVGVDGRPALPGPRPGVAHRLVSGADPRPVELQRAAVVTGHLMSSRPSLDDRAVQGPAGAVTPRGRPQPPPA